MDRRFFIKIVSIFIASSAVSNCKFGESQQQSDEDILWDIFMFSAAYWGNGKHLKLTQEEFNGLIRARQTDEACNALITSYKNDLAHTKNKEKTLERIYFGSVLSDEIKDKTIKVFITVNLMHGGFKVWGLKNYPGFAGGSYNTTAKIPYRIYES